MHFLQASTFVLFSTCLAQVLAHRGGNSTDIGTGSGDSGNGNNDNGNGHQRDRNGDNQAQVSVSTVTVTTQVAAANVTPLTVMTVTVTADCTTNAAAATGDPNAVSTSVIAAPTVSSTATNSVTTARKFVTQAADIQQGLTSLPVAVASALGGDGVPAGPPVPPSSIATTPTVSPGAFAQSSSSGSFAGITFTTSGDIVGGRTSVPVASELPFTAR